MKIIENNIASEDAETMFGEYSSDQRQLAKQLFMTSEIEWKCPSQNCRVVR